MIRDYVTGVVRDSATRVIVQISDTFLLASMLNISRVITFWSQTNMEHGILISRYARN